MNPTDAVKTLVRCAPLPEFGQWAALANGDEFCDTLASNAEVDSVPEVWAALWEPAPVSAARAISLVSRRLEPDQLAWVLSTEKRVSVLKAALDYNDVPTDQVEALLASKLGPKLAKSMPVHLRQDPHIRVMVARLSGGYDLLYAMADGLLGIDEIRERLVDFDAWTPNPSSGRQLVLSRILHQYPELIDVFASPDAPEALAMVAASSMLLTSPTHQRNLAQRACVTHYLWSALVSNPVVSIEVVHDVVAAALANPNLEGAAHIAKYRLEPREGHRPQVTDFATVDDPQVLEWLVKRAAPTHQEARVRPLEVVALSANPHLTSVQAANIVSTLRRPVMLDEVTRDVVNAAADAVLANFPGLPVPPPLPPPVVHQMVHEPKERFAWLASRKVAVDPSTLPVTDVANVLSWVCEPGRLHSADAWSVLFSLAADADDSELWSQLVATANALTA